jgi:DNA-binding response OmpR family regulator
VSSPRTLILNVDDNEAHRYAITRILRSAGYTVAEAADGEEALSATAGLKPALVLLDVKLPDISGIEVCSEIKRRWPSVLVLQTSAAYTSGADRTRGLESGADSYLTQPVEPSELVAAVRAMLRLHEAEEKLRRLNQTLEARVQERTADLAAANAMLKEEIEQRERAEAQLVQAQKMEAIGRLTGGIAHDFNNLLTAVIGNLDRICARSTDAKIRRLARNAFMAAERGSKLTAQLLAFSRTQKLVTEPVDVNAAIEGMLDLLKQSLGPSVEFKVSLQDDLPHALGDPNQLELAILNLILNSRDAIADHGGRISLATRLARIEEPGGELAPGEYVSIEIEDNGAGMEPEVLARAFDPFFTTKAPGKGTGLGLSQVYGIAHEAGGAVHIDTEVGVGTTVRLYLPRSPRRAEQIEPLAPGDGARRGESVLIVDDDQQVRELVSDYLQEIGYETRAVDDAQGVLDAIEAAQPDLLIADFAMPGVSGAEVARQVRARWPHIPILFFSGYADSAALEAAVGDAPLLRKPFLPSELAAAIRAVLNERRA